MVGGSAEAVDVAAGSVFVGVIFVALLAAASAINVAV